MIQPNELRLGNWVLVAGTGDVHAAQINIDNLRQIVKDGGIALPIPLTDEIFEKYGFELFESGKKYWCHGSYMFVKGEKGYGVIHDFDWDEIAEPIEYVHQLQNLIFALTGTELEINLK